MNRKREKKIDKERDIKGEKRETNRMRKTERKERSGVEKRETNRMRKTERKERSGVEKREEEGKVRKRTKIKKTQIKDKINVFEDETR